MKKLLFIGIICSQFSLDLLSQNANALASTASAAPDPLDSIKLAAGDKVLFGIAEDPEGGSAAQPLTVSSLGRLPVPVSRNSGVTILIDVKNKPLAQVRKEIKETLEKDYYYKATIQLVLDSSAGRKGKVLFTGKGVRGSALEIDPINPTTIFEAATQVGLSEFANRKRIVIDRYDPETKKSKEISVNLDEIQKHREKDVQLQDGDRVTVNEKFWNFK